MMRAGLFAAIIAASVLGSSSAWSGCLPGKSRNCVNLDLLPQISQEIIAAEPIAAAPKKAPLTEPVRGYTGPTIGAAPNLRRAPEVGYRWAIN
jgi:hypothetical protein